MLPISICLFWWGGYISAYDLGDFLMFLLQLHSALPMKGGSLFMGAPMYGTGGKWPLEGIGGY